MNFNLPSLPWQVAHSPGLAAVIRHSTFETRRTARQVLGAHSKNNTVGRLLHSFQDQLFRRWQRTPNKVNTLAHLFKVSNMSSFPPPACTESAEEPVNPRRRSEPKHRLTLVQYREQTLQRLRIESTTYFISMLRGIYPSPLPTSPLLTEPFPRQPAGLTLRNQLLHLEPIPPPPY
jgi:hypothetical protein